MAVAQTDKGKLTFGGNELNTDSFPTNPDPSGNRIGSTIDHAGGCGGGGKISFDDLPNGPDGPRHEMVMLHGEQDQAVRGEDRNPAGCLSGHFNRGGETDADMVKGFEMTASRLWLNESWVWCLREQLGGTPSPASASNKLVSPDGRVEMDIQNLDALNVTVYVDGQPWFDFVSILRRLAALEAKR